MLKVIQDLATEIPGIAAALKVSQRIIATW